MKKRCILAGSLAFLMGCGGGRSAPLGVTIPKIPKEASVTLGHDDDPRIGTFVSSRWGFATSSYWIIGPEGLVLIDTQFLLSAAREAVDWAEQSTGKKVVAALVLHANPDKFNGTATLQARGIKVLTSSQVLALIPKVHQKRLDAFYERYTPDYPKETPHPESFGDKTTELRLAGLTLRAHVLGPACSEAHVAIEWEKHLFVGDLVTNGGHAWLELGRTEEWIQRLAELRALAPERIHPGRGPSGGPGLLDRQSAYLRAVIDLVAAESPSKPDDEPGIERAIKRIAERFPGYEWEVFLRIGIPAEWNRQAALHK